MYEDFLTPLDWDKITDGLPDRENNIANHIMAYTDQFESPEGYDLAIIGVEEDRVAVHNKGCGQAPDAIRRQFYGLDKNHFPLRLADLGNIKPGETVQDTYIALEKIMSELLTIKVVPIILGGSHDLTYAQYRGYAANDQIINMAVVDEVIDIYKDTEDITNRSFLYRVFTESPNYLFNFSQIGYQSYFVAPDDIAQLEQLHFEFHRLGDIQADIEEVEPIVRDADMLSFDIGAVRMSDAPGHGHPTPHGFYGEEACRIARYAGITDKLTSFGLYGLNPDYDKREQTTQLAAHMLWYFLEGFYSRKNEYPIVNEDAFLKYTVHFEERDYELTFWKSKKSGRWWMELPVKDKRLFGRHRLIPCSYADYEKAVKDEIPDRWLRGYEKIV